jgi:hypothetical protein
MKEFLHENLTVTKKTGVDVTFVADGVRVDMRRLSSHTEAGPKKPAASATKATKATKAKKPRPKKRPAKKPSPTPAE